MPRQSNPPISATTQRAKPYRFGAIVSIGMGNMTRYLSFRKYADRDSEVNFTWHP